MYNQNKEQQLLYIFQNRLSAFDQYEAQKTPDRRPISATAWRLLRDIKEIVVLSIFLNFEVIKSNGF